MISLVIGLLCINAVVLLFCSFYAARRDVVVKRLSQVNPQFITTVQPILSSLIVSNNQRKEALIQAGYHAKQAEFYFLVFRLSVMVLSACGYFFYQSLKMDLSGVAQAVVVAILVGLTVDKLLEWKVKQVRLQISRVLPDALDLMVICVASGLTLEAVFRRVGEEMKSVSPALSREWILTATELSILDSPKLALQNLDNRVQLTDVNNMVVTMIQAQQFGTPMAKALNLIAADSRQYHFLELEEWVGKIPAKMSIPLVLLIMLPVVVVIVAPVVLSLLKTLGGL